jgi:hypothetical protein
MNFALALLLNPILAKDLNIGVFSDVHLNLRYTPESSEYSCGSKLGNSEELFLAPSLKK